MKKSSLSQVVLLAILGAWAFVFRQFDFPVLLSAPFLKVDLSDLWVLVGMLVKGPVGLLSVAGIRDLLNYLIKGGEAGLPIGATMSVIASLAFFMPTHFGLLGTRSRKIVTLSIMSVASAISLVVVMCLLNYFVALPLYIKVLNFPIESISEYVWTLIAPFNAIKAAILGVGQVALIRFLPPLLRKMATNYYTSES